MKIVTVVGMLNKEKANYGYDDQLKEKFGELKKSGYYTNMLPLLIDNFDYEIVPIFTEKAKNVQISVLKNEFGTDYSHIFDGKYLIDDEKNYYDILSLINEAITEDNEYIIDLTHGFRHIPILATIALITHNISNSSNIKHILFAKEIKHEKEYEIIDLKEYLELANMSYMLASFADNYTVSKIGKFTNESFQALSNSLSNLSNKILSNSIKDINESLKMTIDNINVIKNDRKISALRHNLAKVEEHIKELQEISKCEYLKSRQSYEFSELLGKKGYLLNAITLLFEAIGYYCLEKFKLIDKSVKEHIELYSKEQKGQKITYELTNNSRKFVKKLKGIYLVKNENVKKIIIDFLNSKENIEQFREFIIKAEDLRNDLAHGNNGESIEDANLEFKNLLDQYKEFCIDNDILAKRQ
ncbi:MAG: TM1812 family CRISPR-associated protein [Campylobacteraceae bacterium]|nr:TM1812 family CRISPR-associated protein [Campylobacteraceae bacterium]